MCWGGYIETALRVSRLEVGTLGSAPRRWLIGTVAGFDFLTFCWYWLLQMVYVAVGVVVSVLTIMGLFIMVL